jgi:hypothetical protein
MEFVVFLSHSLISSVFNVSKVVSGQVALSTIKETNNECRKSELAVTLVVNNGCVAPLILVTASPAFSSERGIDT